MRAAVNHVTRLEYGAAVTEAVIDVRLGPLSDEFQRWMRFDLNVSPNASVRSYRDGYGNASHLITVPRSHRYVEIEATSEVQLLLEDAFHIPEIVPPALRPTQRLEYLAASPIVQPSASLEKLAEPFRPASPELTFDAVGALMGMVYEQFEYETGVTSVSTTIPEVLSHRRGVCQDFAHVLIGLCRALEIPARYVSGYIIHTEQNDDGAGLAAHPSRGEGASHAWVEAFTPTHGWRGFDPTNNLLASLYHVKMAVGRDYRDIPPTRGTHRGQAVETLSVRVETQTLPDSIIVDGYV